MLKALNMKLLILILTALAAISAVIVNHEIHAPVMRKLHNRLHDIISLVVDAMVEA